MLLVPSAMESIVSCQLPNDVLHEERTNFLDTVRRGGGCPQGPEGVNLANLIHESCYKHKTNGFRTQQPYNRIRVPETVGWQPYVRSIHCTQGHGQSTILGT